MPFEREAIARARPKQIDDRTVMVAAAEDLVLMKLVSERAKDRDDAVRLLSRYRGSLDSGYLEPRLKELAEALAMPEILEVYRRES